MIGKVALTAGLALSLVAAGSSAQAASLHKKHPAIGQTTTCKVIRGSVNEVELDGTGYANGVPYYPFLNGSQLGTLPFEAYQGTVYVVVIVDPGTYTLAVEKGDGTIVGSCTKVVH